MSQLHVAKLMREKDETLTITVKTSTLHPRDGHSQMINHIRNVTFSQYGFRLFTTSARQRLLSKWHDFRRRHDTQQAVDERIQQEQASAENDPNNTHKIYFHHPKPNSESQI